MYTDAKTFVRTVCGNSNGFEVKVGIHQCSAFRIQIAKDFSAESPLLFEFFRQRFQYNQRVPLPWELLYADDLVDIRGRANFSFGFGAECG